jgi:hypothetical protein
MNAAVIAAPQNLYSTNDDELLNATGHLFFSCASRNLRLATCVKSITM